MSEPEQDKKTDWIDWAVRLGKAAGLNPVQLRWKLMAWRESWKNTKNRTQSSVEHIGYLHKVCPYCSNIQDRSNKVCSNCGKPLSPRAWEILKRLGFGVPQINSVSSLLVAAILICYVRTVAAQGGNPLSIDTLILFHFGGNYPPAVMGGQWWRLSTYIFLHAGLWHITFNLIALQQIGPEIEEIFGKRRMLFFFMATGIAAGIGSELMGLRGVGIGASGSLMGLIGLAAGWGQRNGTSAGLETRNLMLQWALYTLVFGAMIGADNAAHISGFLCGALLGWISKPEWQKKDSPLADWLYLLAGGGAALGTFLLVMFPPSMGF